MFRRSDIHDLTYKCVQGVLKIKEIKKIHVVLGGAYDHQLIFKIEETNQGKVLIHKNLSEGQIIKIMENCHLGVIPSSTISYEACSVKMILLGGYYVDNQINIYEGFKEKGIIYAGGDFTKYSIEDFEEKISEIIRDSSKQYQKMLKNQQVFFDGKVKNRFVLLVKELS